MTVVVEVIAVVDDDKLQAKEAPQKKELGILYTQKSNVMEKSNYSSLTLFAIQ